MTPPRVAANFAVSLIYVIVFHYCYIHFLNYWFEYVGFPLYHRPSVVLAAAYGFALVPVFFHRGVRAVSSVVATFVYALLYVPVVMTFALGSSRDSGTIFLVEGTFCLSMIMLFSTDALIIESPLALTVDIDLVRAALALTAVLTLAMVAVYGRSLAFVGFSAVYEQRAATSDLGSDIVSRYLFSWLDWVFIPICLAHGLTTARVRYVLVASAACVVFYMATATKLMILLPFVYAGIYFTFRSGRLRHFFPVMIGGLAALLVGLSLNARDASDPSFLASSVLIERIVGTGGQLTMAYADFFATHPQTNYSHLNIVNALTGSYPYGSLGLGEVVGHFYWSDDINANANFWATDGFAAMGLVGVPFATALCAAALAVINSVTRCRERLFAVLCFIPFTVSILNTSLFSTMLTGGGAFLILFFLIDKHSRRSGSNAAAVSHRVPAATG